LHVHDINDIRQTEVHTAEPLAPELSYLKVEIAIEKLKRYKSSDIDQILAELIQEGGTALHSEIHKLVNSIWNKEDLPHQWEGLYTYCKKGDKTDCSNYSRGISLLPVTYKILSNILVSRLTPYIDGNYWGSSV